MSRYIAGKEPKCPTQSPNCTGLLYRRDSKQCEACYRWGRQRIPLGQARKELFEDCAAYTPDKCEITKTTATPVRTLDDLIRVCEIDTDEWRVERWVANTWGTEDVPHYQVKATLIKRVEQIAAREEVDNLIQFAKRGIPPIPWLIGANRRHPADLMLEIDIFDLHAGKLAWGKETGHENYDSKIASRLYSDALEALVIRATSSGNFDHILLVTGNDLLNSDNTANTTTHGTPQSTDVRFHKTFAAVRETIIHGIERLRHIAPVIVPMVPGNHDTLAVWHLGDSLECYFHNCKDVTILNAPTLRKYHQFGKVMLMFTHGNKGKHPDYPLVMATEQPKMFGETRHREAHVGHTHESRVHEYHGVRVRTLSALTPADAWHSEHQFVGNQRAAEAFVWHREEGLIGTATYTAPFEEAA